MATRIVLHTVECLEGTGRPVELWLLCDPLSVLSG